MPELKCQAYLEYLDKEMNIMGILSAFCVALGGLGLERTAGAEEGTPLYEMWKGSGFIVSGACGAAIAAGLIFYLQRSLLAWYYGQLVLAGDRHRNTTLLQNLLGAVDAWDSWTRYYLAFAALYVSFLLFASAIARQLIPSLATYTESSFLIPVLAVAITYSVLTLWVMRKYRLLHGHPWKTWLLTLLVAKTEKWPAWITDRIRDLSDLRGDEVVHWRAVEMALRMNRENIVPQFHDDKFPVLQLAVIHVTFADRGAVAIETYQDFEEWGLCSAVPDAPLPSSDAGGIFRVRDLHELPCGAIADVQIGLSNRGNISRVILSFENGDTTLLVAGKADEQSDGTLRFARGGKSILVFRSPSDERSIPWS